MTVLTSREFNRNPSRAKKAAHEGAVFITDRGRPTHILLTIEEYRRWAGGSVTLAEALAQTADANFAFEPPRMRRFVAPVDLE